MKYLRYNRTAAILISTYCQLHKMSVSKLSHQVISWTEVGVANCAELVEGPHSEASSISYIEP